MGTGHDDPYVKSGADGALLPLPFFIPCTGIGPVLKKRRTLRRIGHFRAALSNKVWRLPIVSMEGELGLARNSLYMWKKFRDGKSDPVQAIP